jgi:hypothetical protein
MTRACALLAVTAGVLLCAESQGGSVRGAFGSYIRVEANAAFTLDKNTRMGEQGLPLGDRLKFRGGQRATVIVVGDHDPIVPVILEVYDDKGKLVARDEPARGSASAKAKGNDVCAVVWYPPRDSYYAIKIRNLGKDFNKCWVAIN